MNASYVFGLTLVNAHMKRALGAVTPWDVFNKSLHGPMHGSVNGVQSHPEHATERGIDLPKQLDAAKVQLAKQDCAKTCESGTSEKAGVCQRATERDNVSACQKTIECEKNKSNEITTTSTEHVTSKRQALPHSHEDQTAHTAQHGAAERKEHLVSELKVSF